MNIDKTLRSKPDPIIIPKSSLDAINKKMKDKWGTTEDKANFRLVWSEDQFEKRWTDYTKEGFKLLSPQLNEVPKYRQWIQEKYIVERLTVIPEQTETDLIEVLSYEPIYTFEDKSGDPLLPVWSAIDFMIENLLENMRNPGVRVKYKDTGETEEEKMARIKVLQDELFGNENDVTDALAYKDGVGYTGPALHGPNGRGEVK